MELALILKDLDFSDKEVAKGICEAMAAESESISAVNLGAVILHKTIFTHTTKEQMIEADEVAAVKAEGTWEISPGAGCTDANGSARYIAKAGYTMPGKAEGALIGRLGNELKFFRDKRERFNALISEKLIIFKLNRCNYI